MFVPLIARTTALTLITASFAFAQQPPNSTSPHGRAIFSVRCAKCHGEHGEGISAAMTIAGPSLQAEHDHGEVMTALETGPSHMPNFSYTMSVDDMRAVADYVTQKIAVIPLAGGNISEGGKLFREYCSPCHRTAVRGGAMAYTGVNAPNLVEQPKAIVAGAVRRGPGPMPEFPASVISDRQLDSIVEYVNYAQHPDSPGGNPLIWFGPVAEGFSAWIILFAIVAVTGWIEKGGRG